MQGTLSSNTTTSEFTTRAGATHVHVSGTFGGGTLTVQFKDENGNWRDIANAAFTTAADKLIDFPYPTTIRGNLSGATTPSLVYSFK